MKMYTGSVISFRAARRTIPLLIAALALPATTLAGGPWTLQRGEGNASVSATGTKFDRVRMVDGSSPNMGRVKFVNTALSVEYGVTENFTATMTVPYESSRHEGVPGSSISGLTDLRIGGRYAFWRESEGRPLSLGAAMEVKTPLRDYSTAFLSSPGDNQTDLEIRLLAGRVFSVGNWSTYADVESGYRLRMGDPPNEVVTFLEAGVASPFRLSARLFLHDSNALGGVGLGSPRFEELAKRNGEPPFPAVGEDFTRAGLAFDYELTPLISVGVFAARAIHVRNSAFDRNFGTAVSVRF